MLGDEGRGVNASVALSEEENLNLKRQEMKKKGEGWCPGARARLVLWGDGVERNRG